MEEHGARFTNLEQRDKEKTTLIAKLDEDINQEQIANTYIAKSPTHLITFRSQLINIFPHSNMMPILGGSISSKKTEV